MKKNTALSLLLLPSALGVVCFFVLPCLLTLHSSLAGGGQDGTGYGLGNYAGTAGNPMFRLGVGNFLLFALIAIPAAIAISLGLALLLRRVGWGFGPLLFALLLPFVLPSGSTAFFWNSVFGLNGIINRLLFQWGREIILWDSSGCSILIPVVIYLWRFCGLFAVIFWVGLGSIPAEYYEIARLEGAGRGVLFRRITLVCLTPTLLIVLLLSFVATFRISRELFMLFGNYPHQNLYFFQHFLNNQLGSMNLPVLCAATVMVALLMAAVILSLWGAGKRASDALVRRENTGPAPGRSRGGRGSGILLTLLAALFLLPVLLTVSNSLLPTAEVAGRYSPVLSEQSIGELARGGLHFVAPAIFPARATAEQYLRFLANPVYLRMFWNSALLLVPILLFHPVVSVAAAYAFLRLKKRWTTPLLVLYILLTLLPVQVMLTPHYVLFRGLGLADSYLSIILPAIFHPIGVCIVLLQLRGFPAECIEAAELDGAGELCILRELVLPCSRGSVVLLLLYTFAEYWNTVDQAVVFLGGSYRLPLSVFLADLLERDLGVLSAGSVIYLLPAGLVFVTCLLAVRGEE